MKNTMRKVAALLATTGLFVLSSSAFATNGYFTHGVGTESKGMAGTGIGSNAAQGAIIAASMATCSVTSKPTSASAISPFTAATASRTPLPR